jgi:pyrroloquinoline quinone (PQQ) biosynthesis protein C
MNTQKFIDNLQAALVPIRQEIVQHPLYENIQTLHDVRVFTQHHIYAVWDFMSLLKSLQNHLTCTSVPWFPTEDRDSRYLINEIVVGEESDIDLEGNRLSHFELYLQAMERCGADTSEIHTFLSALKNGASLEEAFETAQTPHSARAFVTFTFDIIKQQKPYLLAAVFTFGREDLIPDMFHSIIEDLNQELPESISLFKYYLDRHIEVDGDHHSHLALQMTSNLCGEDPQKWEEVLQVSLQCLEYRKNLWTGVLQELQTAKASTTA